MVHRRTFSLKQHLMTIIFIINFGSGVVPILVTLNHSRRIMKDLKLLQRNHIQTLKYGASGMLCWCEMPKLCFLIWMFQNFPSSSYLHIATLPTGPEEGQNYLLNWSSWLLLPQRLFQILPSSFLPLFSMWSNKAATFSLLSS